MISALRDFYRSSPYFKNTRARRAGGLLSLRAQQEIFLLQLRNQERYLDPRRLARFEYQVYSMGGEDGIIAEIFRRIGTENKTFLELGVGDGLENNTTYLLSQGWTGCWVDGDRKALRLIRDGFAKQLSNKTLKLIELFVTKENIMKTLDENRIPHEVDLLSVDLDRNTYWIWSALSEIRARVAVIEYNSTYPASVDWKIEYDPEKWWDETFQFGASLKALERLGSQFGYSLIGCDLLGSNAFFVRQDLCGSAFLEPFDAETHYEPARYWLARTSGHRRGYPIA
jgi:hypothetical protein